ncbi:MAG: SAM-dependent methyltransferase [Bacteroidetes bacterium]|nr:SAM-dependent methyltransferase [Bacteroidota bacterium]
MSRDLDKNENAVAIFNKLAKEYQSKFMDVSLYGDTFDRFCNAIKSGNARVLELACGPGNITKYLLSRRPELEILGTDLSENMIALAAANNPAAEFRLMDCRNIGTLDEKYDAVMCGFCLPYLSKEEALQLIRDASKIIRARGIIYISTMEDEYSNSGLRKGSTGDEIFMHYHESDYLIKALEENGFEMLETTRKEYPGPDGSKTTDIVLIAQRTE